MRFFPLIITVAFLALGCSRAGQFSTAKHKSDNPIIIEPQQTKSLDCGWEKIDNLKGGVYNPQLGCLANGMQIVVVPQHMAPVVYHSVWYRVGAADETPGKSGLAHFLEHLMFKPTKKMKDGEFSKIIAANGGRDNAFTSQDYTGYYQVVPKNKLELVMSMEADRMVNLELTEKQVATERDVIISERRERIDSSPESLIDEQMNATVYRNHPYRIEVIGWEHEMAQLTRQDAFDFYKKWYAPNNAILIVVGDTDLAEVLPLAEKYYGPLIANPEIIKTRQRPQEPPFTMAKRVMFEDPRVQTPVLIKKYVVDFKSFKNPSDSDSLHLSIESFTKAGTGELYQELIVNTGVAQNVGGYYRESKDYAEIFLYAYPRDPQNLMDLETKLNQTIENFVAQGMKEDDFLLTKTHYVDRITLERDSLTYPGIVIGQALTSDQTIEYIEQEPARIESITFEQTNRILKEAFNSKASVTGVLKPSSYNESESRLK